MVWSGGAELAAGVGAEDATGGDGATGGAEVAADGVSTGAANAAAVGSARWQL
jgi:hypothetical protein